MKRSPMPRGNKRLTRQSPLLPGGSSLKRVRLERKTSLESGKGRRKSELVARAPKPAPKDTGPTRAVRHTVKARAAMRCERCGVSVAAARYEVHHRQPRQMGGTSRPETNLPSNLLLLCAPRCHSEVESSRQISYERGWLVRAAHNPATAPVFIAGRGWTYLRADGTYAPTERTAA